MAVKDIVKIMLRITLMFVLAAGILAQKQQGFGATGRPERAERPPPPPLSQTMLQVFDKDHSGGVTLKEVSECCFSEPLPRSCYQPSC